MFKSDIYNKNDISILVKKFYHKIHVDKQLGPIFNRHLVNEQVWEHHYEILINFWEAVLFRGSNYKGQTVAQHLWVDSQTGRTLNETHFQHWLDMWQETIDELYEGPNAELAKTSAVSIAQAIFSKVMEVRKNIDPTLTIKRSFEYKLN